MNRQFFKMLTWGLFVLGLVLVGFAWFSARRDADPRADERINIYDADIPQHGNIPIDPRFLLLTPYDWIKAPLADIFTAPLGSWNGAFTYDAQPFGEENEKRGGKHFGQDWNGIGGMSTDLGDSVYAAGRGRVVYAGQPSPTWGNMIVLLHRLPDGKLLQSLYAHLDKMLVRVGDMVARGQEIGKLGDANRNFPAHLHFEMIDSSINEAGLPGYGNKTANRIDPDEMFRKYSPSPGRLIPDVLPELQRLQSDRDLEQIQFQVH